MRASWGGRSCGSTGLHATTLLLFVFETPNRVWFGVFVSTGLAGGSVVISKTNARVRAYSILRGPLRGPMQRSPARPAIIPRLLPCPTFRMLYSSTGIYMRVFVTSSQASLLLAIFGLFQPYPTMADPILAGCLFLCHPRTSARMRLVIPVGMAALVPSLLLPTMRHLWLQAGTGNANFYYFQTVALNVLLAVFVLQFAAALVKRRKALALAFERRRKAGDGEAEAGGGAGVDEKSDKFT